MSDAVDLYVVFCVISADFGGVGPVVSIVFAFIVDVIINQLISWCFQGGLQRRFARLTTAKLIVRRLFKEVKNLAAS